MLEEVNRALLDLEKVRRRHLAARTAGAAPVQGPERAAGRAGALAAAAVAAIGGLAADAHVEVAPEVLVVLVAGRAGGGGAGGPARAGGVVLEKA